MSVNDKHMFNEDWVVTALCIHLSFHNTLKNVTLPYYEGTHYTMNNAFDANSNGIFIEIFG